MLADAVAASRHLVDPDAVRTSWTSPSSPTTFGAIFVVELPDKTFIAALVLSTRYKPLAVWIGVGLAFGVQTLVAVTAGALATLLPDALIKSVALR